MARALVIEEESGICSGFMHPHNGYYAGDFHRPDPRTCRRTRYRTSPHTRLRAGHRRRHGASLGGPDGRRCAAR